MRQLRRINAAILFLSATIAGQTASPAQERKVALIIGNDGYRYVTHLKTAVNDARAMQVILHDRYGFETTLLTDATRAQIMAALSSYRRTLGADASLLIYYAGHGYADPAVDESYWWPVDAKSEDNSEWISADDITKGVKALSARHVLIVSDSCFSGTLSRGVTPAGDFAPGGDRAMTLTKLRARPSRELFASGGNEPVADGGAGDHSIFAGAFLRALQSMEPSEFAVEEIFREVRESVGGRSSQLPELNPIRNSGHDGGAFVFSRVGTAAPITAAPTPTIAPRMPEPPALRTGQTKVNPKDGLTYVWIPPGTFTMGCSPGDSACQGQEKRAHQVTITTGFWIGQTTVTQQAYERVVGSNPSKFKGANLPVETVIWDEAQHYCRAVEMRLPTEAEWEYAARAGSTTSRYGDIDQIAWYNVNDAGKTHDVAQKQPNAWGLYDMLGNVSQWTADRYIGEYSGNSETDPKGPPSSRFRTVRGGAWSDAPANVRASWRLGLVPEFRDYYFGFRCVGK